jgi:hypothetical protein
MVLFPIILPGCCSQILLSCCSQILLSCCSLTFPFISFQLLIFSSSLLFNTLQPLLPLLSFFSLTTNSIASQIDYNKFQPRFIFLRDLHSYNISCLSFFLKLHYYYTCFHCSYLDNDYNNNKFF